MMNDLHDAEGRESLPAEATADDAEGAGDAGGRDGPGFLDVLDEIPGAEHLTDRQRVFISLYIGDARFNSSRAAVLAGYKNPKEGSRLLARADIRRIVRAGVRELMGDPSQFLTRLAAVANADFADIGECMVTENGRRVLDWSKVRARGLGHIIKRVSPGKGGDVVELEDRAKAVELIGKAAGWITEKPQVQVNLDISSIDDPQVLELIARGKMPAGLNGPAGLGR